jgi:hypothetical protein
MLPQHLLKLDYIACTYDLGGGGRVSMHSPEIDIRRITLATDLVQQFYINWKIHVPGHPVIKKII